jgi:hypothetical protein
VVVFDKEFFLDKQDYEAFLKTIGEVHDRWAVEVFAYCIMGNHHYVCLRTPEGNLPRVMSRIGTRAGSYVWSSHRFYLRRSEVPEWPLRASCAKAFGRSGAKDFGKEARAQDRRSHEEQAEERQ